MDACALREDVALHFGVPSFGLVPEVNPGFEQLSDTYSLGRALQDLLPLLFRWLVSSARTSQSAPSPRGPPPGSSRTLRQACVVTDKKLHRRLQKPNATSCSTSQML